MNVRLVPPDVEKLVSELSNGFQRLEEKIRIYGIPRVDVRFPRGVIRPADDFRRRLWFVRDPTLKSNIAYSLMATDVYRWVLNRFDIALTAREMIIKDGIVRIGAVIEGLVRYEVSELIPDKVEEYRKKNDGRWPGIRWCLSRLVELNVISPDLKKAILDEVWAYRNLQHLYPAKRKEWSLYTLKRYNRCVSIWKEFLSALDAYHRANSDGDSLKFTDGLEIEGMDIFDSDW